MVLSKEMTLAKQMAGGAWSEKVRGNGIINYY